MVIANNYSILLIVRKKIHTGWKLMGIAGFWIGFIIQILILHIYRLQETKLTLTLKG